MRAQTQNMQVPNLENRKTRILFSRIETFFGANLHTAESTIASVKQNEFQEIKR